MNPHPAILRSIRLLHIILKPLTVLICITAPVSQIVISAEETAPESVRVYPASVNLTNARDRQSLLVQAVYAEGVTRDVTDLAEFTLSDPTLARFDKNVLHGQADGTTTAQIRFSTLEATISVKITNASDEPPVSFKLDVMPVFMKAGCNTGSCHGAAQGKDGFRLSLFGFDPDGDYHRLTREISGRRINLALPEECLMINKATGKVPHTGGRRIKENSEHYATFVRWLRAGAPKDEGQVPAVTRVDIFPPNAVLQGTGAQHRITVQATYADGSDRDVTSLAFFMSNNDNSATINQAGMATAAKRGEAFIMARFETFTVGSQFIVLPTDDEFTWQDTSEYNYIDSLLHDKFRKLRIQPSDVCSDEEFLRRATLDITGTLPTRQEYHEFIGSPAEHRRNNLIDQLVDRKEFVEMWVMKWAELLQIRSANISYKSTLLYYNWLQERISNNVPINQMVRELLGSNGGTFANAATNYYQSETNTLKVAENVAQVFMGMRIQCTQCHNHPFDRWTMNDYYSFAAFFSQIGRKNAEDPREKIVFNSGSGEVSHPVDGRNMQPKFLGGGTPELKGQDRRAVLAKWLASSENPYFARNLANIVWAHFFGRGIIHEVDDVRVSNPPVNAELLDELAQRMTEYNYDFKRFVRDICKSRSYQLSTQVNSTNASDVRNFSHATLRRLRSEVLLDVISQVTDTKNKFRGLPLGARAVQIADGNTNTYFLTTFGRATRQTVCSCEVKMEPNLSQALHLLNGDTVNSKIEEGNLVKRRLEEGKSVDDILDELYVRCLTRRPNEKETMLFKEMLAKTEDEKLFLEDTFWALLNSREFLFNH